MSVTPIIKGLIVHHVSNAETRVLLMFLIRWDTTSLPCESPVPGSAFLGRARCRPPAAHLPFPGDVIGNRPRRTALKRYPIHSK